MDDTSRGGFASPSKILPHGPEFRFVDEIVSFAEDELVATRRVPLAEPWTDSHFPGDPIVPGVLLIEGLAQCCGLLARLRGGHGPHDLRGRLASVRRARFHAAVRPGDSITYRARWRCVVGDLHDFVTDAFVADKRVADVELVLALEPPR